MTENAKREGPPGPRMRQTLQGVAISLLEALLGLHEGEDDDE